MFDNLKQVLNESHKVDPETGDDGYLSKKFMFDMHKLLYRYKKLGAEIISEGNFHVRIDFLR